MFNKAILMGRLTRDPESTSTPSGVLVTKFTVAVNRRFKKEGQPEADFINCVSFSHTAEFVQKNFVKGQAILLCGSIQTRTWDDNEGNKRWATEVIAEEVNFCGSKSDNAKPKSNDVLDALRGNNDGFMPVDNDDSVPF